MNLEKEEKIKEKDNMIKKYQVIMQDEWNNLYHIGFFDDLKDAIPEINDWLSIYEVKIDELHEYASTFDTAFDLEIGSLFPERDDLAGIMVRGFVFE